MKVSVIIATYNRAEYIEEAIRSVLFQSYKDIEIIVVDDGSTDNTKKLLDFYIRMKGVRYIYQKNAGSVQARDNGIRNAKGKYIAILDSDDVWCDQYKLQKQVEFLEEHPDYVLVGGSLRKINEDGKEIAQYTHPEKDEDIRETMFFNNMFAHSAVVYRKDAWEAVGGYCNAEDWNLWFKLGKIGKMYNFLDYFIYYLEGSQNTSRKNIRKNLLVDIELRKKYRNDYPNFWKAFILSWASYFYSYFPFKEQLHPIVLKFKKRINENITH